jgi:SAM-dependent methyltransferase
MHQLLPPASWVTRYAHLIPVTPTGQALDLACGSGRHTRVLLARGLKVVAIDRDAAALAELADSGAAVLQADLENAPWPLEGRTFDGIVVTNYLWRALLPQITASLAPGGVLIYETFAIGNERYGKPSNPNFLLAPGELLRACRSLQVLAYQDVQTNAPKPACVQRIVAIRRLAP